jgi:alginate O-acetyltransferase complex protein AlgI
MERYWEQQFGPSKLPHWIRVAKTMLFVMLGWVMFRAADIRGSTRMFAGMLGMNGVPFSADMQWHVTPDRLLVASIGIALVYAMPWLKRHGGGPARYLILPLFLWAVATLSSQSFTPFLYFQF